ncbi:hypothetical protein ACFVMC_18400 [Nocardia sp. NPDC127579]
MHASHCSAYEGPPTENEEKHMSGSASDFIVGILVETIQQLLTGSAG